MSTVPRIGEALQYILKEVALEAGRSTGFIQRERKLNGSSFVETMVFSGLSGEAVKSGELNQMAATVGVGISPQGIEKRFNKQAAECLRVVLEAAVSQVIEGTEVEIELLQRFAGVYLLDSSTVSLPPVLTEVWAGCGGSRGANAAVKIQVELNYSSGALHRVWLQAGREHDRSPRVEEVELPAGALRVADLGYFKLDAMHHQSKTGVFWLTRLQAGTQVYDREGDMLELVQWLNAQALSRLDCPVFLGATHQLPCRLLAWRMPPELAQQRRRKLNYEAHRAGQKVSAARLALADWTLLVTNVPLQLLSVQEAFLLYRVRWQIELLFKLWKSTGALTISRSQNPWRILCEFYAKLLAVMIHQWCFLIRFWSLPFRSLTKAARTVQHHASFLAVACQFGLLRICEALEVIDRCLVAGCRIDSRRTRPNTYQFLLNPSTFSLS